jgi:hypothetical protein
MYYSIPVIEIVIFLKKHILTKNMLQVQTKPIKWFLNHYLKVKCAIDLKRHPQY